MLIDSHCHLNFQVFAHDWQVVVKQAQKSAVKKILVIGVDLETSQKAIKMAVETNGLYATVGFHPHHCRNLLENTNKQISVSQQIQNIKAELIKLVKNKKVVAIGESGLDYFVYQRTKYKNAEITSELKKTQKELFGMQIQLAKEINLPMIIHNREAGEEILDTIDHFCKIDGHYPRGMFHCISGNKNYLAKVLEMGFYIGVDGNITYNEKIKGLARLIPLNKLLIETDSPYLTPEPIRSKLKRLGKPLRNEPVNVKIVAEAIAKVKSVTVDQIRTATTENAETLFNI